jgi:lysophospholipase L1-like esterase
LRQPGGGKFKLSVDGKVVATISTKAKEVVAGVSRADARRRAARDRGQAARRRRGPAVRDDDGERAAGVVIDTLGIGGTRAANQLKWDEHVWADNLRRARPDLVVLAYGTNESVDEDQPIEAYRENLREVLARLRRAAPEASCLLVGPGDFPIKGADGASGRVRARWRSSQAQREVAGEAGCAFWDAMQFMGGEQSMVTWAAAQPAMAQSDHLHLTRRGYTRMGMALADALMFDYDAATGVPGPIPSACGDRAGGEPAGRAREFAGCPGGQPACPWGQQARVGAVTAQWWGWGCSVGTAPAGRRLGSPGRAQPNTNSRMKWWTNGRMCHHMNRCTAGRVMP